MRQSKQTRLAAALTAGQLATAGTAFIINILSSTTLSPEDRGLLALLLQVSYLLGVAAVLGVERPFASTFSAPYREALWGFYSATSPGLLIALLPMAIGGGVLLFGDSRPLGISLILIGAYVPGIAWGKGARVAAISSGVGIRFAAFIVTTQGTLLLAAGTFAGLGVTDPRLWLSAYVVASILGCLACSLPPTTITTNSTFSRSLIQRVRRDGLRLLPASFGNTAMLRSDRLLLPALAGNAELGYYVAVATMMETGTWPVTQWVDTSLRRWSQDAKAGSLSKSRIFGLVLQVTIVSAALSLVLAVGAFIVVSLVLPPEYAPARVLILPLALASISYSISRLQQGVMIALGSPGWVSAVEIGGLLASIAGYLLLIPIWGSLGAAWASAIGYTAGCLLAGWRLSKAMRASR